MKLHKIIIGSTLHICDDASLHTIKDKALSRLNKGDGITWEDGKEQWYDYLEIIDVTKTGSEMFTWDRSGDRVKCRRVLTTVIGDELTREEKGFVYRKYS